MIEWNKLKLIQYTLWVNQIIRYELFMTYLPAIGHIIQLVTLSTSDQYCHQTWYQVRLFPLEFKMIYFIIVIEIR